MSTPLVAAPSYPSQTLAQVEREGTGVCGAAKRTSVSWLQHHDTASKALPTMPEWDGGSHPGVGLASEPTFVSPWCERSVVERGRPAASSGNAYHDVTVVLRLTELAKTELMVDVTPRMRRRASLPTIGGGDERVAAWAFRCRATIQLDSRTRMIEAIPDRHSAPPSGVKPLSCNAVATYAEPKMAATSAAAREPTARSLIRFLVTGDPLVLCQHQVIPQEVASASPVQANGDGRFGWHHLYGLRRKGRGAPRV